MTRSGLKILWCEADRSAEWQDVLEALKQDRSAQSQGPVALEDFASVRQGFWLRTPRGRAQIFFVIRAPDNWIEELTDLLVEWLNQVPDGEVESVHAFLPSGSLPSGKAVGKLFRFPVSLFRYHTVRDHNTRLVLVETVGEPELERRVAAPAGEARDGTSAPRLEGAPGEGQAGVGSVPAQRFQEVQLSASELEAFLEVEVELAQYFQSQIGTR